ANAQELELHAALAEDFDGVEGQVDPFLGVLAAEVGDDRDIALEARKYLCQRGEVGGGVGRGLGGQLDAVRDAAHLRRVDAHLLVQAGGVVAADGDRGPA